MLISAASNSCALHRYQVRVLLLFLLSKIVKQSGQSVFIRMFHTLLEFLNEFVKGFPKLYNYETNYAPHDGQDDFTYTFTNL